MKKEVSADSSYLSEHFCIEAAVATRNGKNRSQNEDRYIFLGPGNRYAEGCASGYLFGVMDGCGADVGAAFAAQLCADRVKLILREASKQTNVQYKDLLEEALQEANEIVLEEQKKNDVYENMACSATILWVWEDKNNTNFLRGHIVHVGDSRIYHIHQDISKQVTEDHKIGQTLYNVIGMRQDKFAYQSTPIEIKRGEVILIATDGLWKPYPIDLGKLIRGADVSPERIVYDWLERTKANGSEDDQTAIAIIIE